MGARDLPVVGDARHNLEPSRLWSNNLDSANVCMIVSGVWGLWGACVCVCVLMVQLCTKCVPTKVLRVFVRLFDSLAII